MKIHRKKIHLLTVGVAAALCAAVFLVLPASAAANYSNDFESNTNGWFGLEGSSITRVPSGETNAGGYATGIASASGEYHARLWRGECDVQIGGGGNTVNCPGPYTDWGGYNSTWTGGYTTQVDIYLDSAYAQANEDSYGGNIACLTEEPTSINCKGTRFDFTSAINDNEGNFKRDFGFNVSTGYGPVWQEVCPDGGFVVTGQTNVNRTGANPNAGGHDPQCVGTEPGWYTFKHTFSEEGGYLKVVMEIIPPAGSEEPTASWTITGQDKISEVGCNRYGWFSDQEIYGLPIDNASMKGCGAPTVTEGQISPTKTTCEEYRDGTASTLGEVQYTTKGDELNALSPGVFFYYGSVSGEEGEEVEITQANDGESAPAIPILNGQVVLYDATTCKKLKWDVTEGETGEATGTLPSSGEFIVGVKYSPSQLKGEPVPDPDEVTYSFGTTEAATIALVPKH